MAGLLIWIYHYCLRFWRIPRKLVDHMDPAAANPQTQHGNKEVHCSSINQKFSMPAYQWFLRDVCCQLCDFGKNVSCLHSVIHTKQESSNNVFIVTPISNIQRYLCIHRWEYTKFHQKEFFNLELAVFWGVCVCVSSLTLCAPPKRLDFLQSTNVSVGVDVRGWTTTNHETVLQGMVYMHACIHAMSYPYH